MDVWNRGQNVLVIVMVTNLFLLGTGTVGLGLDINPEKCTATMEESVHLSCVPDGLNQDLVNEITLIKISRNDEKEPIAFLSHCSNITYGSGVEQRFQAKGYIGKDSGNSYLNLTLMDPRSEDTGIYTCVMFYVDTSGDLKEEVTSGNLIVEKLDVKTLEVVLNDMRNEIENVKISSNTQINMLQDKVTFVSAFSVTNGASHLKFSTGQKVVMPNVIMKLGQGYDATTGVFTAPKDGLYTFHLTSFGQHACNLQLSIDVNDKPIGRLYTLDKDYWDQGSISVLTELQAGDKVSAVWRGGSCLMHNNQYSMFSGTILNTY